MMAHKFTLFFSTIVASALYGFLFVYAPDILLIGRNTSVDSLDERFQVKMDYVPKQQPFIADSRTEQLSENPLETLDDLLERETELMPEIETAPIQPVEIPELQQRLDSNALNREHNFEIDESVFAGIDAQIMEIAEEDGRKDIDIARRLVQPSSDHILKPGENPVFRGNGGGAEAGGNAVALDALVGKLNQLTSGTGERDPGARELASLPGEGFDLIEAEASLFNPDMLEPDSAFSPEDMVTPLNPALEEIQSESRFGSMDALVDVQLKTYVDASTKEGYFELKIVPDATTPIPVLPRDVTFVIDASNSIVQRKLQLTARGVQNCLALLRPEDHFNVIIFRDSPTLFSKKYRRPLKPSLKRMHFSRIWNPLDPPMFTVRYNRSFRSHHAPVFPVSS
jgi:hypothetical protein